MQLGLLLLTALTDLYQIVPKVSYAEIQAGLSAEKIIEIRDAGVVVVRGAVPEDVCSHMLRFLSSTHLCNIIRKLWIGKLRSRTTSSRIQAL
jgi:Protein of unknown function (DUF1479)